MNPNQQHSIKINAQTLRWLKLIAASTGERQYAVLERLVATEWHLLHPSMTNKKGP